MARLNTVLFLFAILFACAVHAHGDHGHDHDHDHEDIDESAVVVLGEHNFDEIIAKNEFVFVEFYAPWCGHCKHLAPEYAQAALTLKNDGSTAVVGKVDATQHQGLATKYGVRGYPTLKFFRSGVPTDYDQGRTAADIVNFIKKKSGPPSSQLASADAISHFKGQPGTQIIAYLYSDQLSVWLDVAKTAHVEEFALGHVVDSSLFDSHRAPAIVIHRDGEEPITYSGDFDKTAIAMWADVEGHPLINELAQPVWQRAHSTKTNLIALFFEKEATPEDQTFARNIALKFKGKAVVTTSSQAQIAERWGTSGKKFPTAIFVKWDGDSPKFVVFDEENENFDATTAENFVTQAISGEYKSFRRSEPIPESNDGPVKVLVGKNFEQIVYDKTKDVFVEFYAPWCGHCKKLTPIWEELGTAFKSTSTVVIGKMDATTNTAPSELDIKGFPTLIFFPADNKSGVPYDGERDLKSLKKFVADHASTSVNKDEL
jgi:protein disulfide-isomerase A1